MSAPKRENENSLKDILCDFFDAQTVLNFTRGCSTKTSKSKTSTISAKNVILAGQPANPFIDYSPIDFIITRAEVELAEGELLKLLSRLGHHSITSGDFTSAVYIFEKLLAISKAKPKTNLLTARTLLSLGDIFSRQALWGISFNYINEAYSLFKQLNNNKGCADCENLLGSIYGELGNLKQAQIHFEAALAFLKHNNDACLKGKIEINLGIINNIEGNYKAAFKYYKSALNKFNTGKDLQRVAEIRHNLGMLNSKMHKYELAIKEFDRSISLSSKKQYLYTLGISYLGKAVVHVIKEDYELSDLFAEKALQVCHKINDRLSIADVYKVKGIIYRDTKNYELAENYLLTSLRINTELKNEMNKAETEFELGILYKRMKNSAKSKTYFEDAKIYYTKIGALNEVKGINKLIGL
ncbi:MAG: tetratricopeptide repeat protein [Ignavibacteriaceae bacterium]|nr:tetratricopeptide repeat protein [Ignavibacteriaceae bacterium]